MPVAPLTALTAALRAALPTASVLSSPDETLVYECDGWVIEKASPDVVVFPTSTEQVAAIVRLCNHHDVPFVPRGAGTGLAGGCLPIGGGVAISTTRMNRILEMNVRDRYAVVEPGCVNLWLTRALKGTGWHYAPDPSSQGACTIGGNVATNSGGPHTLKYGVTVNHVLGVELVTSDGEIVTTGGPIDAVPGLDLRGVVVGSEGTLGIVTKAWVRLTRDPEGVRTLLAIFDSISDATTAISDVIAAGSVPAALEMLDQGIIGALEQAYHLGFPLDAQAILLIEVDGLEAALDEERDAIESICRKNRAREIRHATTPEERQRLWAARKRAFGAVGRLSPSYCTQDGVVPRTRLPEAFERIQAIGARHSLRIVNVFHAGDGNLHPLLLFDEREADEVRRVLAAGTEILEMCIDLGGSITGEHGIGIEKLNLMSRLFSADDLDVMARLRDAWNPGGRLNPGKLLPTAGACPVERRHPGKQVAS